MKNIIHFKNAKEKITMVTCYDACFAKIINETDIDAVLVGDSVAMTVYGYDNTTHATVDMLCAHTQAVSHQLKNKLLISDLPFLSYHRSISETMQAVYRIVQAGAQAVKLEGGSHIIETVRHIVASGVPVMGHLGLTAQSVHQLGGHRIQGKTPASVDKLLREAKELEEAGCFAMVLEGMPAAVAKQVTDVVSIPTIGIGAGADTSGQILVLYDMLGLTDASFTPKFLKHYAALNGEVKMALQQYTAEVKQQIFPDKKLHCYEVEAK